VSGDKNKYLYQGKELQEDLGLDVFDFEWRMYDPAIGRTFQLDLHADNYFDLSPYSWVANNPLKHIDPTGMDIEETEDRTTYTGEDAVNKFKELQAAHGGGGGKRKHSAVGVGKESAFSAGLRGENPYEVTQEESWYNSGFFHKDAAFTQGLIAINEWNPLANLVNGGMGLFTGYDINGREMSGLDPGITIAGAIPLMKGVRVAKLSAQGGLNLFKWGAPQTTKNVGWRTGDYFLHLPNKGTPKLNWKANYGALRREMGLGKPIFDSYRLPNGNLIKTGGFLNAERNVLQSRGWIYNSSNGAWMPPIR
jgi:RHS repeat-associated protein